MEEKKARVILGDEFFEGLRDFYREIRQSKHQYKVCLPRRSYVLNRIFMDIDGESEVEFDQGGCMTDSALFSLCGEIADFFMATGRFPDILICDDILIHGRAMNAFLVNLENRLIHCLRDRRCELDDVEIRTRLTYAVDIWVYIKNNDTSLLLSRYLFKVKADRIDCPVVWRNLSNRIAVFICDSGEANANFVISVVTEYKKEMSKQNGYKEITKKYRDNAERIFIKPLDFGTGEVKAVFTVREIAAFQQGKKRLVPFVFLPALQPASRDMVLQAVIDKIAGNSHGEDNGINDRLEFMETINHWRKSLGRICDEFISLVLSQNLLLSFMEDNGMNPWDFKESTEEEPGENGKEDIEKKQDRGQRLKCAEICKIAHHYGNSQAVWKLISYIGETRLFTERELIGLLKDAVMQANPICKLSDCRDLDERASLKLCEIAEDVISDAGWQAEKEAYELWKDTYIPTKLQYKEVRRAAPDFISEVKDKAGTNFSLYDIMAYILQFMDNGLMVVSVYKSGEDNDCYEQYCKTGEQSITVQPKRCEEYIPLLIVMNREHRGAGTDFGDEFQRYCRRFHLPDEWETAINELNKKLKETNQTLDDWDFLMQECTNYIPTDDLEVLIFELIRKNYGMIKKHKEHIREYRS